MTKSKKITIYVLACIMCLAVAIGALIGLPKASANGYTSADAYFVNEDRETLGMWYTGVDGTKANRNNRVYGRAGVMLAYHGQTDNGNGTGGKWNDFQDNSDNFRPMYNAHYMEYPSWMSSMQHVSGGVGVWNNSQPSLEERVDGAMYTSDGIGSVKPLLYINYNDSNFKALYGNTKRTGTASISTSDATWSFNVTDNNWHLVTFYVGLIYTHEGKTYAETRVTLQDAEGRFICDKVVTDSSKGVYVTFAVKGSFRMKIDSNGYPETNLNGIFFDDVVENSANSAYNLTASLVGAKQVKLSWINPNGNTHTNVYRREQGDYNYEHIATLSKGTSTYTDNTAEVSKTYQYAVTSGTKREYSADRSWDYYGYALTKFPTLAHGFDVKLFNTLNYNTYATCQTATYTATGLSFSQNSIACTLGEGISTTVRLTQSNGTPIANAQIKFTLGGERVYNTVGTTQIANMKTDLGTLATNANGEVTLAYVPQYAGNYTINANFAEASTSADLKSGYQASSAVAYLYVNETSLQDVPVLFSISDAITPGDAFNITGNFLCLGGVLQIAYAPANGEDNRPYSETATGLKTLPDEYIVVRDTTFNTGVSAVLPPNEKVGIYDFWVKNIHGWSNAITMNGARALFISQDGGYNGMPIELVGRNLLGEEFGASNNTKVMLKRVGNLQGVADGNTDEYVVDINVGLKWTANQTFLGEDIQISNPYRIEFTVPNTTVGTYDVYVSNMGNVGFSKLRSDQQLKIYQKLASNYGGSVFGTETNSHIGNDPLDLKVHWAQNFDYANVQTMPAEYSASGTYQEWGGDVKLSEATQWVQTAINTLSANGGGVVYFPNGTYYLSPLTLASNVMLVGQSKENTIFNVTYQSSTVTEHYFNFIGADDVQNVGVARLTIQLASHMTMPPDLVIKLNGTNLFVSDVNFYLPLPAEFSERNKNRGMGLFRGEHLVYQNVVWRGEFTPLELDTFHYTAIRNVDIEMRGWNNGMGFKYAFLENTKFISGSQGHGWSGRDTAYCAYNYIQDVGRKNYANNKGEVFYFEPPASVQSIGYVLAAENRTITLYTERGSILDANSTLGYNQCAVQIIDGRGAGQIRYFDQAPIAANDGVNYGNTYQLCWWENDWQVLPDHTSQFSVFEPMTCQTIYNNKAVDCAKSLMLFSQCNEGLIVGNHLTRTEGIQIWNDTSRSWQGTNMNIRIQGNYVDGVSLGTGNGGIEIFAGNGAGYKGLNAIGIVIRDNVVKNIRNFEGRNGETEHSKYNAGIHLHARTEHASTNQASVRMIIVENNHIENCEYGIRADAWVFGVVEKGNTFAKIGVNGDIPSNEVYPPCGRGTEDITLINTQQFHRYTGIAHTHTVVTDPAVQATCSSAGKTEGSHCSTCSMVLVAQTTIPQKEHTAVELPFVAPTCNQTGLTKGSACSVCGYVIKAQNAIVKTEHTVVVDYAVAPTVTKDGKTEGSHCGVCGEVLKQQLPIPAIGHTVIFDTAGGTTVGNQNVKHGQKVSMPNNPTKTGYLFDGWAVKNADGTTSPFDPDLPITSSFAVVAQWKQAEPVAPQQPSVGCKGSVGAASIAILTAIAAAALAVVAFARRKKAQN